MIQYVAPNPYPIPRSDLFSWFSSFDYFSKKFGKVILPAQNIKPALWFDAKWNTIKPNYSEAVSAGLDILNGSVATFDKAILDTIEIIPGSQKNIPINKKHFIIKFKGYRGCYENWLSEHVDDAVIFNLTVIGFNYRGVGKSKKEPAGFQDLITDGIAQVQRLLDEGANSQNILLDGLSMGAAVATLVAAYFHKINKPVYVWNDRSFSSLSAAAVDMVASTQPVLIKYFIRQWISMMGWDVDVASAYEQIPEKYKAYMIVAKLSTLSKGDTVISHASSLHTAIRKKEQEDKHSTCRKVFSNGIFDIGHKDARKNLISKDNTQQTGQDLFGDFVRKIGT